MIKKINEIKINGRKIGPCNPPYIIAEMSANHNGKLETALKIISEAKKAGADAIKLQTYTADTITLDCDSEEFRIDGGLWSGKTLHQLYKDAHMPWDWHRPLFERARELDITIFSSPFDPTAVDLLENLNVPAYKIASFEAVDLPLIKYIASTGKPIILSTGMANAEEIQEAIDVAKDAGCKEMAILHCVSGYPAPSEDYNLNTIADKIARFGLVTGLSDHTLDNTVAIASVALGASIIEKHFTLDRNGGGPDDTFSLEPGDLAELCSRALKTWKSLGQIDYRPKSSEIENIKFRRSLYFVKNMKAGELISYENVRSIRPGFGLPPKELDKIIGKQILVDVKYGTPVAWDLIKLG